MFCTGGALVGRSLASNKITVIQVGVFNRSSLPNLENLYVQNITRVGLA
jgi:hypothetical protein